MERLDNLVLLADKTSNVWDFAEKMKEYICRKIQQEIPLREVSVKLFSNGEIDMHIPESVRRKDIYFVHDSTKNPQEWWIELLLLQDLLLSNSAESVSFVLPNLLYSRQDRRDKPHVPISARALADSLSPNIKRVLTMDLHSPQIQGFYDSSVPLENLYSFPVVVSYLRKSSIIQNLDELVVVSPDAGGVKRAEDFSRRLKPRYPMAFLEKRRDTNGERKINKMILVGSVRGRDVLLIDDIIDSGGTLCKTASVLKKRGAGKLYCYGTHGLFTKGLDELSEYFDGIYCTNSYSNLDNYTIEFGDPSSIRQAKFLNKNVKQLNIF